MLIKRIEEIFECISLILLITLIFLAAVLRYFGTDVSWSVDMAQLLFAWICFIGADLALRSNAHMGVNMIIEKFPEKIQKLVSLFCYLFMFGFLILILIYGINLCIVNYQRTFNTIYISYSWVTLSVPVGSFLMLITVSKKIITNFKQFLSGDFSVEKNEHEGGDIL